ncbi:MAG: glycosyltransferase [Gammaproteobacteria bacterium]|nr:glycosyltransferase [Gammaproteobacteria bacterium]
MPFYPVFLSVVLVLRNRPDIERILTSVAATVSKLVSDYELIIVDNASDDESVNRLQELTSESGLPNLQAYVLTKEVDRDTASWVGLENALGDFIAVFDPLVDDIDFLPIMIESAVGGMDVVFASNKQKPAQSIAYKCANSLFNKVYERLIGVNLAKEAPQYRLLSKRVVNFILQHPQPSLTYRHLPATGGFSRINLDYNSPLTFVEKKRLGESVDRGMRLLVATTRVPMRLVTWLSLFGAVSNLIYSIYVLLVGIFKSSIAPGWVSLSLQQSGMFFLISLVLLVLGEYILHMASLSNESPLYHVGREFNSAKMSRNEKLNIVDASFVSSRNPQKLEE